MVVYLHIPKTAGTAIKNLKVDNPSLPLKPAVNHSFTIKNFEQVSFGVRDPLERFCSGYWERVTQDQREMLNNSAPAKYRRSGYKPFNEWEVELFKRYQTPNDVISAFVRNECSYDFILEQKTPLSDLFKPYTCWLGKLEDYIPLENKVSYAFNVSNLSNIFEKLFNIQFPDDPFLSRSRQQFNMKQSYFVSAENTEWFKNEFRKDDYVLLEHIKQQNYYLT